MSNNIETKKKEYLSKRIHGKKIKILLKKIKAGKIKQSSFRPGDYYVNTFLMDLNNPPSKFEFTLKLSLCDEKAGNYIIWVDYSGKAYITLILKHEDAFMISNYSTIKYRYETMNENWPLGKLCTDREDGIQNIYSGLITDWEKGIEGKKSFFLDNNFVTSPDLW